MTHPSRRNTLKLGAAALVLGPSVMFSGTVRAADNFKHKTGHKIGQFIVKVDGIYDEVPGVVSVDLGTITLFDPITFDPLKAPSYSGITIGVANAKDIKGYPVKWEIGKISPLLGKGVAKKVAPATALKLSVSLLAADGKTPAVTYHANNAVPISIETDMAGVQTLRYAIDGIDVVTHDVPRHDLKGAKFKAEIEGLGTMAGLAMTKAIYDWKELKGAGIDGTDKTSPATGPKFVNTTSLVTFVTGERPASALVSKDKALPAFGKVKFWASEGATPPSKDWRFSKAVLTSIELPKLQVGSDALVTETLNFKIEATRG